MKVTNEELETIIKYRLQVELEKIQVMVAGFDCSERECRKREKSPDSCKGAQATTYAILTRLEDWVLD